MLLPTALTPILGGSGDHQVSFFSGWIYTMAAINTENDMAALCRSDDPQHPANLIPELCRLFYTLGWVTGTGGGISIRDGYVIS